MTRSPITRSTLVVLTFLTFIALPALVKANGVTVYSGDPDAGGLWPFSGQIMSDLEANGDAVPQNFTPDPGGSAYKIGYYQGIFPYHFWGWDPPAIGGDVYFRTLTAERLCYDISGGDPTVQTQDSGGGYDGSFAPNLLYNGSQWFLLVTGTHYFTAPFPDKEASSEYFTGLTCTSYALPSPSLSADTYNINAGDPVNLSYNDAFPYYSDYQYSYDEFGSETLIGPADSCSASGFDIGEADQQVWQCDDEEYYDQDDNYDPQCYYGEEITVPEQATSGTDTVYPTAPSTTYQYTCNNANGSNTASVTINVNQAVPSPVPGCTDSSATNYNPSATVDDGSCTYSVPGCTDPSASNYNPSATVNDGSCTYTAAPTCQLYATPSSSVGPGSPYLSWTIQNADSASIDNGVGFVNSSSGWYTPPPINQTTTYTLTANGPGGTGSCNTTVTIEPACWFTSGDQTIVRGQSATLSWDSSDDSAYFSVSPGIGGVDSPGSAQVSPTQTTTYQVNCASSPDGPWNSGQTTITVESASFNGSPSCTIPVGSSGCNAPVSWTSANVPSVNLTDSADGLYGNFPSGLQSSQVYIPYNSGSYNIRDADSGTVLATVSGTSACAAGSSWNGSSCSYPSIIASCSVSPTSTTVGAPVTWSATASGGTGSGYTYNWSGTNLTGQTGQSVYLPNGYSSGGTYTGAVKVTDPANDSSGSVPCSSSVSITPAPSCSNFSPSPSSVLLGNSTTLSWSCQNSNSCTAVTNSDGFSTSGGTCSGGTCSGSDSVTPSSPGQATYAITCTGPSGPSTIDSSPVTVLSPSVYITATPLRIAPSESTQISWSAQNITGSCSVTGTDGYSSTLTPDGSGNIATTTHSTGALSNPVTYTLSCPKASSSITVNVAPGFQEF